MTPRRFHTLLAVLVGLLLAGVLTIPLRAVEVTDASTDEGIFTGIVSPGDRFQLLYIHSVEHMPVRGVFEITGSNGIKPVETVFPSYGAGMPFLVDREDLTTEQGMMKVRHHGTVLDELRLFVSHAARQRLVVGRSLVPLFELVRDGGIVTIRVRRRPLFLYAPALR